MTATFFSILKIEQKSSSIFFESDKGTPMATFLAGLGDIQVIEKRKIYGALELIGDLGGIFSSIFTLGSSLHFLLVGAQESHRVLSHFFKVDETRDMKKLR